MGRPTAIKLHEFDVPPPTSDDFEVITRPEILFIELAKLAVILGRIQDLHARQPDNMQEVRHLFTAGFQKPSTHPTLCIHTSALCLILHSCVEVPDLGISQNLVGRSS